MKTKRQKMKRKAIRKKQAECKHDHGWDVVRSSCPTWCQTQACRMCGKHWCKWPPKPRPMEIENITL